MGFTVSRMTVFDHGIDITQQHLISDYYYFSIPKCYNPWSYNGDVVCFTSVSGENLQSDIHFYSLSEKKYVYSRLGNSIGILCSPSSPYILMDEYEHYI